MLKMQLGEYGYWGDLHTAEGQGTAFSCMGAYVEGLLGNKHLGGKADGPIQGTGEKSAR